MKPYIQALCAVLLWSTLAWLGLNLSHVPPFLLVGTALMIGSLCSVHRCAQWSVPFGTLLLGIYGLFGFHFCLFMALRVAPPVEANLINYLWPLLMVVFSPVFLPGYSLKIHHVVAALLGLSGAVLIVTGGAFHFRSEYRYGYMLAAISAWIWASYSLMTRRVKPFPGAAIGLFCLCSGLLSLLMHGLLERPYVWVAHDIPFLLVLGLGPMGGAFFLWDAALKKGDPRTMGSLAYLTPMLSTLLLVWVGGGSWTRVLGIAMMLIVSGAILGMKENYGSEGN